MPSPRLSRLGRRLIAAALLLVALGAPASASASCVMLPPDQPGGGGTPWDGSDAVFVGTVTALANGNRWATVQVEEVWAGPDQPAEVVVRGGPEGDMATSVDRSFVLGTQYVFGVMLVDGQYEDNACSGTIETSAIDLEGARPDDARDPGGSTTAEGAGFDLGAMAGPALVVGLIGVLLLVTVLIARRREA